MSLARCLEEISPAEFDYWQALFELEPGGPMQEDLRAGYVASLLFNANRVTGTPAKAPADFFPSLAEPPEVRERREHARQVWLARIWAVMNRNKQRRNRG